MKDWEDHPRANWLVVTSEGGSVRKREFFETLGDALEAVRHEGWTTDASSFLIQHRSR